MIKNYKILFLGSKIVTKTFNKMYDGYYWLKHGLCNTFTWLPVIWNDHDFDGHYFYIIMRKKLKTMRKLFSNPDYILLNDKSRLRYVKQMSICIALLDRIIEDDYFTGEVLHFDEYQQYVKDGGTLYYFEYINQRNSRLTIKQREFEHKKFLRESELSESRKNADKDLLFKLLRKHVDTWWD